MSSFAKSPLCHSSEAILKPVLPQTPPRTKGREWGPFCGPGPMDWFIHCCFSRLLDPRLPECRCSIFCGLQGKLVSHCTPRPSHAVPSPSSLALSSLWPQTSHLSAISASYCHSLYFSVQPRMILCGSKFNHISSFLTLQFRMEPRPSSWKAQGSLPF